MKVKIVGVLMGYFVLQSCSKEEIPEQPTIFSVRIVKSQIIYDSINWYNFPSEKLLNPEPDETSGIAPSFANKNHYWLHEDKGNSPRVMLYDTAGICKANYYIQGIEITDLEDISMALIFQDTLIFLGDMGDNNKTREFIKLISFKDTILKSDGIITAGNISNYKIKYPTNESGVAIKEDCEAFCFDPVMLSFYFFTKNAFKTQVYRLKWPLKTDNFNILEPIGEIAITNEMVTAADISLDGTYFMLKTYETIYYWERTGSVPIDTLLVYPPRRLPYNLEGHGEAACFDLDSKSYVTVSEKLDSNPIKMSIYRKKD